MNTLTGVKDLIGQRCSVWATPKQILFWSKVISQDLFYLSIYLSSYLPTTDLLVNPWSFLFIPQKYRESERSKKPIIFETWHPDPSSPKDLVWFWCCTVHLSGNRFAYLAQDITAHKKLEQTLTKNKEELESTVLARTKQLQDALQVKSRFLAIMSHGK